MKRFITLMVAACAFFAASAQFPMVTLSHNGELSFFTNVGALNAACNAAENGDILYLSEGDFILNGGALEIVDKRLSIVGSGYGSHIFGNVTVNLFTNPNPNLVIDAPLFDGVRLDNLSFAVNSETPENLDTSEITRCWIRTLEGGGRAGRNVTYDKCYIEDANFSYYVDTTIVLKNSKIICRSTSNSLLQLCTAINCNIVLSDNYPKNAVSCILSAAGSEPSATSSSTILNSLLTFTPTNNNLYQYDCHYIENSAKTIFDDKLNCTLNLAEGGYFGQDGSVVGIQGGDSPFSENPSVPTVDTANSSVEYDSSANKLKVTIVVKAD